MWKVCRCCRSKVSDLNGNNEVWSARFGVTSHISIRSLGLARRTHTAPDTGTKTTIRDCLELRVHTIGERGILAR